MGSSRAVTGNRDSVSRICALKRAISTSPSPSMLPVSRAANRNANNIKKHQLVQRSAAIRTAHRELHPVVAQRANRGQHPDTSQTPTPMTELTELGDVVDLAGVTEVDLWNKGIGDEGVARLAAALETNTSVTEIALSSE